MGTRIFLLGATDLPDDRRRSWHIYDILGWSPASRPGPKGGQAVQPPQAPKIKGAQPRYTSRYITCVRAGSVCVLPKASSKERPMGHRKERSIGIHDRKPGTPHAQARN
jgi:hypothetical protein